MYKLCDDNCEHGYEPASAQSRTSDGLETDPKYKSRKYYDVVLGNDNYLGWKAVFVGDRAMHFEHKEKGNMRVSRTREVDQWMRECWDEFVKAANIPAKGIETA